MHHSYEHTYLGLHAWSKDIIQRAGWVILGSYHGDKEHVKAYISKISCLLKCIKNKIDFMKKHDDKSHHVHELEILHMEVSHIKDFFKKGCAPSKKTKNSNKK